jgi:hypothetical protein
MSLYVAHHMLFKQIAQCVNGAVVHSLPFLNVSSSSSGSDSDSAVDSGYARLIELLAVKFVPRSFIDGDILCMVSAHTFSHLLHVLQLLSTLYVTQHIDVLLISLLSGSALCTENDAYFQQLL